MFLCIELELGEVILEGNSQVMVEATKSGEDLCIDYGYIVADTQKLLLENSKWQIVFIHREANTIAYVLAKLSFTFSLEMAWLEDGSIQILNSVVEKKYCNSDK